MSCLWCRPLKYSVKEKGRSLIESRLAIAAEIDKLADSGYQGIAKLYTNGYTPIKKTWNQSLTGEASKFNRELAGRRIPIEHANRWCQIFRIVKETYPGKHRN